MIANLCRHIPDWKDQFEFTEYFGLRSERTVLEYQRDLILFSRWLNDHSYPDDLPIPAVRVKEWLSDMVNRGLKANTVKRRHSAVGFLHEINDLYRTNPVNDPELKGFNRKIKYVRAARGLTNKVLQKEPITTSMLKEIVKKCPKKSLSGIRDRALFLTAFVTAARRSEVCNLKWDDIRFDDDNSGAIVTIRKSKTDQLSEGKSIYINKGTEYFCPIKALLEWREAFPVNTGFIFLNMQHMYGNKPISGARFAQIIKLRCKEAGFNPDLFSGHSTRRGFLVTASDRGAELHILSNHARHHNSKETEHYIGDSISRRNNPTKGILR
ncbi:MAG: tyrosine-type recombinase/integrase [Shewanella sp.]|nr:tyrosine-type recombinase/integrase [Shewanella sp.]MCF1437195.1 tyrosine-type recombinase/integrase [Shewanella sp.]MCF1459491.1 tyrosine-type recombinase/integrase [Shewanella sp.]